jgi:hypothetical protein
LLGCIRGRSRRGGAATLNTLPRPACRVPARRPAGDGAPIRPDLAE